MSPTYAALRDGKQTTIPAEYLPSSYEAPTFNIKVNSTEKNETSQK